MVNQGLSQNAVDNGIQAVKAEDLLSDLNVMVL
jgi:hypothetical protein